MDTFVSEQLYLMNSVWTPIQTLYLSIPSCSQTPERNYLGPAKKGMYSNINCITAFCYSDANFACNYDLFITH